MPHTNLLSLLEAMVATESKRRPTGFTADDVWATYVRSYRMPANRSLMANAFANVKRAGVIVHTGRWEASHRKETHGRHNRVWRRA